ncbi:MAG: right-handed parallel beta-helix repeat-containing protein [Acidobacteriota bacterium]
MSLLRAASLTFSLFAATASAQVRFVDDDAAPGGDGLSWATAHQQLETAMALAQVDGSIVEIRVAGGTYLPTQTGSTNIFFRLRHGLAVLGGYRGLAGGGSPDDRDITAFETILSGDLNGDDGPGFTNRADNSIFGVVRGDTDADSLLEGVTIEGGSSSSQGGGMFLSGDGAGTFRDLVFRDNEATEAGAAYLAGFGGAVFERCLFVGNRADRNGGAIYLRSQQGGVTFRECDFIDNHATDSFSFGGALQLEPTVQDTATLWTIIDCRFLGNSAKAGGGGVRLNGARVTMTNCLFSGNFLAPGGGGNREGGGLQLFATLTSGAALDEVRITNTTFVNNSSLNRGGGMSTSQQPEITNCIFEGNTAPIDPQVHNRSTGFGGGGTFSHCNIEGSGGSAAWLGASIGFDGGNNIDADPLFIDADGADDTFGTLDDDASLDMGSPSIDTGDDSAPGLAGLTRDLVGLPRFSQSAVDQGAYERPVPVPTLPETLLALLALTLGGAGVVILRR